MLVARRKGSLEELFPRYVKVEGIGRKGGCGVGEVCTKEGE